jgi:hypothetical protein
VHMASLTEELTLYMQGVGPELASRMAFVPRWCRQTTSLSDQDLNAFIRFHNFLFEFLRSVGDHILMQVTLYDSEKHWTMRVVVLVVFWGIGANFLPLVCVVFLQVKRL